MRGTLQSAGVASMGAEVRIQHNFFVVGVCGL